MDWMWRPATFIGDGEASQSIHLTPSESSQHTSSHALFTFVHSHIDELTTQDLSNDEDAYFMIRAVIGSEQEFHSYISSRECKPEVRLALRNFLYTSTRAPQSEFRLLDDDAHLIGDIQYELAATNAVEAAIQNAEAAKAHFEALKKLKRQVLPLPPPTRPSPDLSPILSSLPAPSSIASSSAAPELLPAAALQPAPIPPISPPISPASNLPIKQEHPAPPSSSEVVEVSPTTTAPLQPSSAAALPAPSESNADEPRSGATSPSPPRSSAASSKRSTKKAQPKKDPVAREVAMLLVDHKIKKEWKSTDNESQNNLNLYLQNVVNEIYNNAPHVSAFMRKIAKGSSQAPDYYEVIKQPIAVADIKRKFKANEYKSKQDLKDDIDLIVSNCLTYNSDPGHAYRSYAVDFQKFCHKLLEKVPDIRVIEEEQEEEEEEEEEEEQAAAAPVLDASDKQKPKQEEKSAPMVVDSPAAAEPPPVVKDEIIEQLAPEPMLLDQPEIVLVTPPSASASSAAAPELLKQEHEALSFMDSVEAALPLPPPLPEPIYVPPLSDVLASSIQPDLSMMSDPTIPYRRIILKYRELQESLPPAVRDFAIPATYSLVSSSSSSSSALYPESLAAIIPEVDFQRPMASVGGLQEAAALSSIRLAAMGFSEYAITLPMAPAIDHIYPSASSAVVPSSAARAPFRGFSTIMQRNIDLIQAMRAYRQEIAAPLHLKSELPVIRPRDKFPPLEAHDPLSACRISVGLILSHTGFEAVQESAVSQLTSVLDQLLTRIAKTVATMAEASCVVTDLDSTILAVEMAGIHRPLAAVESYRAKVHLANRELERTWKHRAETYKPMILAAADAAGSGLELEQQLHDGTCGNTADIFQHQPYPQFDIYPFRLEEPMDPSQAALIKREYEAMLEQQRQAAIQQQQQQQQAAQQHASMAGVPVHGNIPVNPTDAARRRQQRQMMQQQQQQTMTIQQQQHMMAQQQQQQQLELQQQHMQQQQHLQQQIQQQQQQQQQQDMPPAKKVKYRASYGNNSSVAASPSPMPMTSQGEGSGGNTIRLSLSGMSQMQQDVEPTSAKKGKQKKAKGRK